MTVTEIAFMRARDDVPQAELLSTMDQALDMQDEWCRAHQPTEPSGRAARAVAFWQSTDSPQELCLTTKWTSLEAHKEWIASDANREVLELVEQHVDITRAELFHVDSDLFPDGSLAQAQHMSVSRGTVKPGTPKAELPPDSDNHASDSSAGWVMEDQPDGALAFVRLQPSSEDGQLATAPNGSSPVLWKETRGFRRLLQAEPLS
ncbi:hypothetical protein NKR23_g7825 [Pleurostoma richardsiae]|uniref:ABM domain-containing protein n=1 Tax=Pleurostoma richardsiae TaxID=41990 RepID=A0AA38RHE7_9PEZI|nr:hypothetical protein NKR23_g7825 [Pleurostoma richardsiae]